MSAAAEAALQELVRLEELRCRFEAMPYSSARCMMRDEFERRRPMAWARAREALAASFPRFSADAAQELDEIRRVLRRPTGQEVRS